MLMDSKGFMWFGTHNGLARWDGLSFKYYVPQQGNPKALSHPTVYHMAEDTKGNLWLGTIGGGLNKYDPITETFTTYIKQASEEEGYIGTDEILTVFIDSEENFWLGTYNDGFNLFDPDRDSLINFALADDLLDKDDAFRRNSVFDIIEDVSNPKILWMGTNNGLFQFNKETRQIRQCPEQATNKEILSVQNISMTEPGSVWLATWGGGVVRYDVAQDKWFHFDKYTTADGPLDLHEDAVILDIIPRSKTSFWISSLQLGTGVFNTTDKTYEFFSPDCSTSSARIGTLGHRVYVDQAGRLWAGNGTLGVRYLNSNKQSFSFKELPQGNCTRYTPGVIQPPAFDQCRNKVYIVGSACDGFFELSPDFSTYQKIPTVGYEGQFIIFNTVMTDSKCRVWAGAQHTIGNSPTSFYIRPSFYQLNTEKGQLEVVEHPLVESLGLQQKTILDIIEDGQNRIWLGTSDGHLIEMDLDQDRLEAYPLPREEGQEKDITKKGVLQIEEDSEGKFWLITEGDGLWRFDPDTKLFRALRAPEIILQLTALALGKERQIYVGSSNGFLSIQYEERNGEPKIQEIKSIGAPGVGSIEVDKSGNLWVGAGDGLLFFENADLNDKLRFGREDGLRTELFHNLGLGELPSGHLVIGQTEGIAVIHPDSIPGLNQEPTIVSLRLLGNEGTIEKNLSTSNSVSLEHDQNFFTINFTLLNFTRPKENQFAYKLEGFDTDWVTLEKGKYEATYTKVPPGTYQFQLRATTFGRRWGQRGKALQITILPPWWQTWWAKTIFWLLIGTLLLGIIKAVRSRQKELQERNRLLQERAAMEKETINLRQAALNAQMNPHFIFNCLNSIQSFIVRGDTKNSSRYLAKFAQLVRETLHTSMESSIRLEEEVKMLKNYLELEKLRHENFNYKIEVDDALSRFDTELPPLLVQPIVENAILHGLVEEKTDGFVHIQYLKEGSFLVVEVKDNGIGIEAARERRGNQNTFHQSVGMNNARKRLEILDPNSDQEHLTIENIKDQEGKTAGTLVRLRVKLEAATDPAFATE